MKQQITYKTGEFAYLLGVHTKTLQRWDREQFYIAKRTPTNRRYYTDEDYKILTKYLKEKYEGSWY